MICCVKQSPVAFAVSDLLRHRSPSPKLQFPTLPSISATKTLKPSLSTQKPIHLCSIESLGSSFQVPQHRKLLVECKAYESEANVPIPNEKAPSAAAQKVKIGIYFATWWALNVVFNIYNKKVLNAFPCPWLTSTLSLATGSLMMLISWATRIAEAPKTDLEFWKALAPVGNQFFEGFCFFKRFVSGFGSRFSGLWGFLGFVF